ncbi:hypothetical protein [Leisingera methylohalidivorans]|uniref:hypothetical protein n=1 Tax=Leisingera methylohalidivorans TaxID=133924 RepID=UPI0012EB49A3|nr:hypothetical protein [Leisingera methylohalidivorans]
MKPVLLLVSFAAASISVGGVDLKRRTSGSSAAVGKDGIIDEERQGFRQSGKTVWPRHSAEVLFQVFLHVF